MLELLRNFEQEEGKFSLEELESDEEDNDLASRFEGIDLGELYSFGLENNESDYLIEFVSPSKLWEVLTPEERHTFMKAIEDPTSAQLLMQSEAFEGAITSPWWEDPQITSDLPDNEGLQNKVGPTSMKRIGKKPELMSIPDQLLRRPPGPDTGPPLLYNICAVLWVSSFYHSGAFLSNSVV